MPRVVLLNPFATGWLLGAQCLMILGFLPLVGIPLIIRAKQAFAGMDPEPMSLVAVPAFFWVASFASVALAIRRAGGGWGLALAGGAATAAVFSVFAWLSVYWMVLMADRIWTVVALAIVVTLLYLTIGTPKWSTSRLRASEV
ncbi:MAG: hypothetical protein DYG92_06905 [Leptolyngbya sp. PLA1]|nr:hypothetical protein [Leptolyngbya sp. PLA1]